MKKTFLILLITLLISACGAKPSAAPATVTAAPPPTATQAVIPTERPLPTVTPACISPAPTQSDIDRALSYTENIFSELDWEKSYAVADNHVSVTWLNTPLGAIVYLEALIFPCSYEEPDLNKYYSDENWKAIFQNYESYKMTAECKTNDGLRLYEFNAQNFGFEYEIKYWVENDTDTRVISTMIVFPVESKIVLDEYTSMLFPDYTTCQ